MSEIKVECYAGYRGSQRPQRFISGDRVFVVEAVEDQWYGPSAQYFRVKADDGNIYILRHDEEPDHWSIDAFRSRDVQ